MPCSLTGKFVLPNTTGDVPGYVQFDLYNTGGNYPQVAGAAIAQRQTYTLNSDGTWSGTIYRNDEIAVNGSYSTYWHVRYFVSGQQIGPAQDYYIASATATIGGIGGLATITAYPAPAPPSQPLVGAASKLAAFPLAASTWTSPHNMGTQAVVSMCFDLSFNEILPDNLQNTDINTTVATFVQPQAGYLVSFNVGNWTPSVSNPNYIIGNPTSSQSITGDYPLTIGGSLSAPRVNGQRVVDGNKFAQTDAGIAAAIADCPDGGEVYLPAATYTLSGSLPITISKRITIRGAGWGTILQVGSGVGATTDVFLLKPSTSTDVQGMRFQDFYITPQSGTPGRYGINIDGTNASIANAVFDHIRIDGLGSYPLAVTNASGLVNGTPYTTSIRNCLFQGGMSLVNAGDSIDVQDSVFSNAPSPTSKDITISTIGQGVTNGGAHGFTFVGNNVTLTGGIIIQNAWQGQMMFNNIEIPTGSNSTEANGAMIDLQGNATASVQGFTISNNYIAGGTVGGISGPAVRIDRAKGTRFFSNYVTGNVSPFVTTTANADRTEIAFNRVAPDNVIGTWLSDSGTNTTVDFRHQSTAFRTIAGNGLAFSSIAGTTGVSISSTQIKANPTNGQIGFSSGDPSATAIDAWFSRGGAGNINVDKTSFADAAGSLHQTGGIDKGTAQVQRIRVSQGTGLVAGDFALSAGWGNTAAISGVTGTDQAWKLTITANGTGIAANPTLTLTFHDGAWANPPMTSTKMVGGTGTVTLLTEGPTTTTNVITFNGTPVAGSTYIISSVSLGW